MFSKQSLQEGWISLDNTHLSANLDVYETWRFRGVKEGRIIEQLAHFDPVHPLRGRDGAKNGEEPTHIDASHLHVIVETSHSLIGERVHVFEVRQVVEYRGIAIGADFDSMNIPREHDCARKHVWCSKHAKTVLIGKNA